MTTEKKKFYNADQLPAVIFFFMRDRIFIDALKKQPMSNSQDLAESCIGHSAQNIYLRLRDLERYNLIESEPSNRAGFLRRRYQLSADYDGRIGEVIQAISHADPEFNALLFNSRYFPMSAELDRLGRQAAKKFSQSS